VAERVTAKVGSDSLYLEMLRRCERKEVEYHRIMGKLSPIEKEQVDNYIAICEELEHRRTQLAYELGVVDGAEEKK
jgi:hypothetical protein